MELQEYEEEKRTLYARESKYKSSVYIVYNLKHMGFQNKTRSHDNMIPIPLRAK